MSGDLPESWADLFDRFARTLGGVGGAPEGMHYEEAEEWFRQAVEHRFGAPTLRGVDRVARQLAFQRATWTLFALYEEADRLGDLAFVRDLRAVVRGCFARTWDGAVLEGPAWRLGPDEDDRPTWEQMHEPVEDFPSPPAVAVR